MTKGDGMEPGESALERVRKDLDHLLPRNTNTQVVRLEGGGPMWIAVTCCMVMLAAGLMGALWMSREVTRIDKELLERKEEGQRMQSYLSAIYVNAPHLKPEEAKDADR